MKANQDSKKLKGKALLFLIVTALISSVLLFASPVSAVSPNVDKTATCGTNAAVTSVTCIFSQVPSGDILVIASMSAQNAAVTVTDNATGGTNIYTSQVSVSANSSGFFRAAVWSATPKTVHGLTITIAQGGAASTLGGAGFAVSGIIATPTSTVINSCYHTLKPGFCGKSGNSGSSVLATGRFVVAAVYQNDVIVTSPCCSIIDPGGSSGGFALYSTSIIGSTNFPWTTNTNMEVYSVAGASFAPSATTTTSTSSGQVTVVACTWYQEQCWLFPMLFLALFSVLWVGVAAASKVSTRGMTYVLMSSVTYGTIIEIMMGMLSSELLILIIAMDVVYAIGFSAFF